MGVPRLLIDDVQIERGERKAPRRTTSNPPPVANRETRISRQISTMASSSTGGRPPPASAAPWPPTAKTTADPILRNALRYTISAREYAALHKYVLSRSRVLRRAAPSVAAVERMMDGGPHGRERRISEAAVGEANGKGKAVAGPVGGDDFNVRAVRHALRVFVATAVGMKGWGWVSARIMGGKNEYAHTDSLSATVFEVRKRDS